MTNETLGGIKRLDTVETNAITASGVVTAGAGLNVTGTAAVTGAATATTSITARSATATPAAASAVAAFAMGSAGVGIYWGTGSPSTVVTAAQGSLYIRTDGSSSSTRMYVNSDGATAWVAVTTAS